MANKNVLQVVINGVNNTRRAFAEVARGAKVMSAAVVAAMAAATARAAQFEKGLAEISTLLDGDVNESIGQMRRELLDASVAFGQTMGKLTKARYDIVSAGFTDAADSALLLESASKLAVAGVSDVASTADLLTTAINGLGLEADDTAYVADVLFQTVRKGKTTIDQLAAAFGPVFATARVAKVEIEELGAAMAVLTAAGIDTREAATALNNLLRALAAPSGEAKDALSGLGITLDNGLLPALQALGSVGEDGLQALSALIPNIRALKAAAVAASDVERLETALDDMNSAAGVVESGFGRMSETLDFKMRQLRGAVDALAVELGTALLPLAKDLTGALTEVAIVIRFLASHTETGQLRFKLFVDDLVAAYPALKLVGDAFAKIGEGIAAVNDAVKREQIKDRATEIMREMIDAGTAPMKVSSFSQLEVVDLVALRQLATLFAKAESQAGEFMATGEGEDSIFTRLREEAERFGEAARAAMDQVRADMEAQNRLQVSASKIVKTGFGRRDDQPGQMQGPGLFGDEKKAVTAHIAAVKQAEDAQREAIQRMKDDLASLSEFTFLDFADMAFAIGDAFANVASTVASQMLGLTKGPIMLGRAFKNMAAGILSDLARIISRMLVARALLGIFGGGGGIFGLALNKAAGFKHGGTVHRAASGLSLAGAGGFDFPPMILPGSPGLDRTPILASGGEMIISRQGVNALEAAMKKVQTSPRPGMQRRGRRGGADLNVNVQANRPFNTREQIDLRQSVVEGLTRGERHLS